MTRLFKRKIIPCIIRVLRFLLRPFFIILFNRYFPHFGEYFKGKRTYFLAELRGGQELWIGTRRRKAKLGNTHPWNRYFNKELVTHPENLAEIEKFLLGCKYLSDRMTRSQRDFWEPPDIFEKRRTGDCEDHAIWAWRHLHDLGYKSRFVLGKLGGGWHAWVHVFRNGRTYLLEATQKSHWFPNVNAYEARWSVERREGKKFEFYDHFNQHAS